jgi:hypothetical protein
MVRSTSVEGVIQAAKGVTFVDVGEVDEWGCVAVVLKLSACPEVCCMNIFQ